MKNRPARRSVAAPPLRRTRPVKRASAGLSPVRAGAGLAMLLSAFAVYGVGASPAFEFDDLRIEGTVYTDPQAVEDIIATARGENLFRLSTAPLADELRELPTVADARIAIGLPHTLTVTIEEREPILIWRVEDRRFLADRDGTLIGELSEADAQDAPALPTVVDQRSASTRFRVGTELDPVDVDAATRLASLTPAKIGSGARRLVVVATDDHGFEVRAQPGGWTAIFGFYTASLRTTEIIPGQVRVLMRLLVGREHTIESIVLADEDFGTYVPKVTPPPSEAPE